MPGFVRSVKESLDLSTCTSPSRCLQVVPPLASNGPDASNTAVAGVLLQRDESDDWHPVAYTSRRLRVEERNYHAKRDSCCHPCSAGLANISFQAI